MEHPWNLCLSLSVLVLLAIGWISWLILRNRKLHQTITALETDKKKLQNRINNVRLDYIETKLSPHLFKNILNSVQSHAYQTYNSLDKLSGVLDYILYESSEKFVTPKSEFDFTVNLIEINKIKINPLFNFRIKSQIDQEDETYNEKVLAPLITVDFVENAFKHTDFFAEDSFIYVFMSLKNKVLEMKVENRISQKSSLTKKNSGFGGVSVEQRLKMLYRKNFGNCWASPQNSLILKNSSIPLPEKHLFLTPHRLTILRWALWTEPRFRLA